MVCFFQPFHFHYLPPILDSHQKKKMKNISYNPINERTRVIQKNLVFANCLPPSIHNKEVRSILILDPQKQYLFWSLWKNRQNGPQFGTKLPQGKQLSCICHLLN